MAVIRDGDWRLFDHDFETGRTTWILHHPDGRMTFRTDYPVDRIIADNRLAYNDSQNKRHGDWSRIASIPLNIYHEQLAEAQSQKDEKYMSKWLNDPDNRAFRTFGGTV